MRTPMPNMPFAGMALRQPPMTVDEWRAEITTMKTEFGPQLRLDQLMSSTTISAPLDGGGGLEHRALDRPGN